MSIFLFSKDKRDETEDYISVGFWWNEEPMHKLISTIEEDASISYYLFNFIKIWQTKN